MLNHLTRFATIVVATAVIAGCSSRPMNQPLAGGSGDAFASALAGEYQGLSAVEKASGDHRDADTYALRAAAAAGGNPTEPDLAALREPIFPDKYRPELEAERARLVAALDGSARTRSPGAAARAQAMYDCWVEQSQEDLQPDHIAACRDAYMAAMASLGEPGAVMPGGFIVFFDWDRSNLTPEGAEVVSAASGAAVDKGVSSIVITGHTDTSGSAEYNMGLSQRRADTVKNAMVNQGVSRQAISTIARGETEPLIPTGDGVREPQNRRATIDF